MSAVAPDPAGVSESKSTPDTRRRLSHSNSQTTKSSTAFNRLIGSSPLRGGLNSFGGPRTRSDGMKMSPLKFKQRQSMNVLSPKLCDSPPNHSQEQVHELLSLCSQCVVKTGRYFLADGYSIYKAADSFELLDKLVKMHRILEAPNIFEFISDTLAEMLLGVLSKDLLQDLPDVPKQFVLCDQIAKLTSYNKNVYLELIAILGLVVKNCKISQLVKWMTPAVLRNIVECMDTPDEQEQSAVEAVINSLCSSLPDSRAKVYNIVLKRLQMCAYGLAPYHFVVPGLRFVISNHKSLLICPTSPDVYVECIMPLFRCMFLPVFSMYLGQASSLFYSYFDELPGRVLVYLFKHWPETDSIKVPCFLNHIATIIPLLGSDTRESVAADVFGRLEWCVKSLNSKVLLAAYKLMVDRTFMSYFSDMSQQFLPLLYPHVKQALGHWDSDVDRQARVVLVALSEWNPDCYRELDEANETTPAPVTIPPDSWMCIFEQAKENDPELCDAESFKATVVDCFRK